MLDSIKNDIRNNRKELLRETQQRTIQNMTMQQLLGLVKTSKDKKERKEALKALLSQFLNSLSRKCSNAMSSADASAISALGNDFKGSAGDTAKASAK